jgi:hypothetical protein
MFTEMGLLMFIERAPNADYLNEPSLLAKLSDLIESSSNKFKECKSSIT